DAGDFEGARLALERSRSPDRKFYIMRRIGEARARRCDQAGARETHQKALSQAQASLNDTRQTSLSDPDLWVREIACIQARLGDMANALKTIESSTGAHRRYQAIAELATDRADVGDLDAAGTLIEKIKSPQIKRRT